MSSARDLLTAATARLAAAGVGSPRVDAELLLAAALGTSRGAAALRSTVSAADAARFAGFVQRRERREPLQHIVGEAPFRHVVLEVGPGVFIPRPETELLVDAVLPHLRSVGSPLAVDLCAGSGALAVSIADEVPAARVIAVERSSTALAWLRRNAGERVEVRAGDIADRAMSADLQNRVDVVVCNPPYVPSSTEVSPEVSSDPVEAVFAGSAGLDLMPTVIRVAAELLRRGGILALEHDETHAPAVLDLLARERRFEAVTGHPDLTGRPRFVTARRAMAAAQPAGAG